MCVCMYVDNYDIHTICLSKFCSGDVAEIAPTILNEDNGRPYKPVYLPLNGRQNASPTSTNRSYSLSFFFYLFYLYVFKLIYY